MELMQQYEWIFHIILIVLALMLMLCLFRAILGPSIADRLVSVNMIGTIVMVMISILAVIKNEGYLVDICLIYAMISFVSVVGLTKVYTGVYLEAKEKENKDLNEHNNNNVYYQNIKESQNERDNSTYNKNISQNENKQKDKNDNNLYNRNRNIGKNERKNISKRKINMKKKQKSK